MGSLCSFNQALLYWLKWHFLTSPRALWMSFIKRCYGEASDFDMIESHVSGGGV